MSETFVDLCARLQDALRSVEAAVEKAKAAAAAGEKDFEVRLKAHLDEASKALNDFQDKAAAFAEKMGAEMPPKDKPFQDQVKDFGAEAQVAVRHAAVFLAEAASKGAVVTAAALAEGGRHAQKWADNLKHSTAVSVPPEQDTDQPAV